MAYVMLGGLYLILHRFLDFINLKNGVKDSIKLSIISLAGISLTVGHGSDSIMSIAIVCLSLPMYFLVHTSTSKSKIDYVVFMWIFSIIFFLTDDLLVFTFCLFIFDAILNMYKVEHNPKGKLDKLKIIDFYKYKYLLITCLCVLTIIVEKNLSLKFLVSEGSEYYIGVIIYMTILSMGFTSRKNELMNFKDRNDLLYHVMLKYIVVATKCLILFNSVNLEGSINNTVLMVAFIILAVYYLAVFQFAKSKDYVLVKLIEFWSIAMIALSLIGNNLNNELYYISYLAGVVPIFYFLYMKERSFYLKKCFLYIIFITSICMPFSPGFIVISKSLLLYLGEVQTYLYYPLFLAMLGTLIGGYKVFNGEYFTLKAIPKISLNKKIQKLAVFSIFNILILQIYVALIYEKI